ncbi:MAG: gliding motility protein RemB [Flavobacteriales bacterium]|nr:gliding motility protein RemB [Flavobacteriales bacterium]
MLKKIIVVLSLSFSIFGMAQANSEKFPVFPNCEGKQSAELQSCFYFEVQNFVYNNFKVPANAQELKTAVNVLFEVDQEGNFKVQYVDAVNEELTTESKRVFAMLPKVQPSTYNGKPTYSKYSIRIPIPLQNPSEVPVETTTVAQNNTSKPKETDKYNSYDIRKENPEFDAIKYQKFSNPQFKSHLSIPLSHSYYAQFDDEMNQLGTNSHTSSKPFTYAEVSKYSDLSANNDKLIKNKTSWWGRKVWNENTVAIQGDDYWFTLNPILDLQLGKSDPSTTDFTYVNTRGVQIRGGLGSQLNFSATIYESQGRFADYFNRYAVSIRPSGGNPAVIPAIGIAKDFKTDAFDFPSAEANITYAPSKHFDLQLGHGRNFIGDGYRSLLLSDGSSSYPYFKINTQFWKIKYTNIYTWMKDIRDAVTVDRTYATKYSAAHFLSWNVNKKLNLGFFESVVWSNQNERGFDASFINPIIFYRAVEFSSSSRSGNALLGLTAKYKWNNQFNFYGQFLLDEFSLGDVKAGDRSWKNKFAYQVGAKYYHAFNIKNLLLQLEYNHVRPYVYAHSEVLTNYGHNNQSLGHQWGGNLRELIAIARYNKGRYFADAKLTVGKRGLDFADSGINSNYGSNIYRDYDEERYAEIGVVVGQGNKANIFIADLQAGYLINPQTNLKLFGSLIYRNFKIEEDTLTNFKENTTWFSVGLRCDIFNWYLDY